MTENQRLQSKEKSEFNLLGVKCAGCVAKIQSRLLNLSEVSYARVNLLDKTLFVEYNSVKSDQLVIEELAKLGFGASLEQVPEKPMNLWSRIVLPLVLGGILMIVGMLPNFMLNLHNPSGFWLGIIYSLISLLVIITIGKNIIKSGWLGLRTFNFNMHSLILLGISSAWIYSCLIVICSYFTQLPLVQHLYFESALIILGLINLGAYIEERAKHSTTEAIRSLMNLIPLKTTIIENNQEVVIDSNLLRTDFIVKIRPGEQLPADGILISGQGYLNESMLTGESLPVLHSINSQVIAGSINVSGSFLYRINQVGGNTVLAKIIQLVKNAQLTKPKLAKLADQVAKIFVPVILCIASISAIAWYLCATSHPIYHAIEIFMTVLLIACPCSVGLAIPVALMVGIGRGASCGILIRDASVLSYADKLDVVVLDKTGTITQGKPSVVSCEIAQSESEKYVRSILKSLEQYSEHHLALAIMNYVSDANVLDVVNFESISGFGVKGVIDGRQYVLTSQAQAMKLATVNLELLTQNPVSQVYLLHKDTILARIEIMDPPKEDSLNAINALSQRGLDVIMLTGDNLASAQVCAQKVGITQVYANCTPADKIAMIKQLQQQGKIVGFVGDGVNDAPSLVQANLGISMGNGTDIANQSAAIVLMKNSLLDVNYAIELAIKINQNMRQNLFGAFIYNCCAVILATGILYPWWHVLLNPVIASCVMSLSSITVISNALRLRTA